MELTLTRSESEIKDKFKTLKTPRDVAALLEVEYSTMVYHVYKYPSTSKYTTFEIPKKRGGVREIRAPISEIKILQRKLNHILQIVFHPKSCVHGFTEGRSIVTNARVHSNQKYVLNLDLKDFFPSINFARVLGMFKACPYYCDPKVALVLARLCCDEFILPQGAPTSPVISNMICARMDSQLKKLAVAHKCWYSRYGDDLTFSTSRSIFPDELAYYVSTGTGIGVKIGGRLEAIINSNSFAINYDKVRLQTRKERQEVTGLIVNNRPNVDRAYKRETRAMLHAWERYGLANAEAEYLNKFSHKHHGPFKPAPEFVNVVRGKIEFLGMVRGKGDPTYMRFLEQFNHLIGA